MPNYGDLALCLPASWSRSEQSDQNYALSTVGHSEGVADARLKDDPDKEHQFGWVPPRYLDTISRYRSQGYLFVKQSEGWEKNPDLWEWDAEGFLVHEGARLMFRSKERFLAAMKARGEQRAKIMGKKSQADEEASRLAEKHGVEMYDDDEPRPRRRGRPPNSARA